MWGYPGEGDGPALVGTTRPGLRRAITAPAVQCLSACVNKLAGFIAALVVLPGSVLLSFSETFPAEPCAAVPPDTRKIWGSGHVFAQSCRGSWQQPPSSPRGRDCSPDHTAGFRGSRSSSSGPCCSEVRPFVPVCLRHCSDPGPLRCSAGTRMLRRVPGGRAPCRCPHRQPLRRFTPRRAKIRHRAHPCLGTATFSLPPFSLLLSALASSLLPWVALPGAPHGAAAP